MSELPLHIIDEGSRDKLPVVLLHAFPLHSEQWAAQRRALAPHARVVCFDVRGLGKSPPSPTAYFLEHLVDDLFTVLDVLSIRAALLCGLSMGGYIALRAIEREPQRVLGLFLADTQAASDTDPGKLGRADGLRRLWREGRTSYVSLMVERALSVHTRTESPELVREVRALMAESSDAGMAAALAALATRTDVSAALPKIQVPTRVVVGADDLITPPSVARAMAEKIPHADVYELAKAGHLSNLEAPDEFSRLLIEHVLKVAGGQPAAE